MSKTTTRLRAENDALRSQIAELTKANPELNRYTLDEDELEQYRELKTFSLCLYEAEKDFLGTGVILQDIASHYVKLSSRIREQEGKTPHRREFFEEFYPQNGLDRDRIYFSGDRWYGGAFQAAERPYGTWTWGEPAGEAYGFIGEQPALGALFQAPDRTGHRVVAVDPVTRTITTEPVADTQIWGTGLLAQAQNAAREVPTLMPPARPDGAARLGNELIFAGPDGFYRVPHTVGWYDTAGEYARDVLGVDLTRRQEELMGEVALAT